MREARQVAWERDNACAIANIIDPIYCQNLFKQALSSVPHGKIHGYGSDYGGSFDRAWAQSVVRESHVTVRGQEGTTILRKADGVVSMLALDGDFGEQQA